MLTTNIQPGALIGGVDEAGRGPLAGPVIAAAVVLAPGQKIAGVRDSKLLSAAKRTELAVRIREEAVAWSVAGADVDEIDRLNILQATMLAMQRAVEQLGVEPGRMQIDGNRAPQLPGFHGITETVVGGDRSCLAIGAASILAKTHRDLLMQELHLQFPQYGFGQHKGYPTAAHREALMRYGPCPEHRSSFRPVRMALEKVASG